MINWCNNNQGFLMVILTLIYAITTIIICWVNCKTLCRQKNIAEEQKQITLFSIRNETYKLVLEELHFWRFNNNNQVELFFGFVNKADALLYIARRCQNIFDILTQVHMVFGGEVYERFNEAWNLIRTELYPCIKGAISELPNDTSGAGIIVAIKYKVQEEDVARHIKSLLSIETEISILIEPAIKIFDV